MNGRRGFSRRCGLAVLAALAASVLPTVRTHAAPWEKSGRLSRMIREYDVARVRTVTGAVDNIYVKVPSTSTNPEALGYHLVLKADGETLDIHLGPTWYLKTLDGKVAVGDVVQVVGAEAEGRHPGGMKPPPKEIRAAEVKKEGVVVLRLRREDGRPLWSGF
jgi:hypothetical protein